MTIQISGYTEFENNATGHFFGFTRNTFWKYLEENKPFIKKVVVMEVKEVE